MACFIEILRCLLCVEDDHHIDRNDDYDYRALNPTQNRTICVDPPSYEYSRFSSPSPTIAISVEPKLNKPIETKPSLKTIPGVSEINSLPSTVNRFPSPSPPVTKKISAEPKINKPIEPKPSLKTISIVSEINSLPSTVYRYPSPSPPVVKKISAEPKIDNKPIEPKPSLKTISIVSEINSLPSTVYRFPSPSPPVIKKISAEPKINNKPTESKNDPKSSLKKISVAPEIKKPTEPKQESTPSPSGSSRVGKSLLPIYEVPNDLKDLMKKDKVPQVLTKPLTASTYSAYFAALLNAEDYYTEKWNGFLMSEVTLQLHEELSRDRTTKKRYVKFEIDSIPEKRPFLLSRDFVIIKPSGKSVQPFKGSLSRVMKSIWVLAEFKDDFYSQFLSQCKYDVSFSFNRVPLKRTHEAIAAASDPSFHTFLFPDPTSQISFSNPTADRFLGQNQTSTIISRIFSLKSPPPYLVEGPLSVTVNNMVSRTYNPKKNMVSRTGVVLVEAILQLYRASPKHRILVVAPRNNTCDTLMERLQLEIPGSETFRANAAFRDLDEVPEAILSSSLYEGERFKCPPLAELQKYRVITSTYISSFKIRTAGINAGHFSHIFLVDASSATEPELMVALTNLANEKTAVVVTGSLTDHPAWVRSDIAREMGLSVSYFERLMKSRPYSDRNPGFVGHLED